MKKFVSILLVLVLGVSLAACGGNGGGQTASAGENAPAGSEDSGAAGEPAPAPASEAGGDAIALNVWIASSGETSTDDYYRQAMARYTEKEPGVQTEVTFIAWSEYFTKVNTGFVGGAGPDMLLLGYGQMGAVQGMGHLLPLNDYLPADWDGWEDFNDTLLSSATATDGKLYGMLMPTVRLYAYRKDIAEQQGVTAEELIINSHEDLKNLARKMTVKDSGGKLVLSGLDIITSQNGCEQQLAQWMNQMTDGEAPLWLANGQPGWNSEIGLKAMQDLYDLYSEGVSMPSDPASTFSGGLMEGTAAMGSTYESSLGSLEDAYPGQIGVLQNNLGTMAMGDFIAVNKNTKYPQQAVELFVHFFDKDECTIRSEKTGAYSGRVSLDTAYVAMNPLHEQVVNAYNHSKPYGTGMNPHFLEMVSFIRTAIETVYTGAEVQATFDAAAEEYVSALAE